jgi:deazaflavin-dependent oxidoreductase (nitroreductase family)
VTHAEGGDHGELGCGRGGYNTTIIEEFRAGDGPAGGPWAGVTLILIHHIGARSGIERATPVACHRQPGGRFAIRAANGGSPTHPNWYYNLKARPQITAEVGARAFTVPAQEPGGTARAGLWPEPAAAYPSSPEPRPGPRGSSRCSR